MAEVVRCTSVSSKILTKLFTFLRYKKSDIIALTRAVNFSKQIKVVIAETKKYGITIKLRVKNVYIIF